VDLGEEKEKEKELENIKHLILFNIKIELKIICEILIMTKQMEFKLFEFNIYNKKRFEESEDENEDSHEYKPKRDNGAFVIQMFGINKEGQSAAIFVEDYQPFFYLKVDNSWGQTKKLAFMQHLKTKLGPYYENSIVSCKLVDKGKLFMFDNNKKHRFIAITFSSMSAFNKTKNLWYTDTYVDGQKKRTLLPKGYKYIHNDELTYLEIYESNIPPLLRYFHIKEISPSGWISLSTDKMQIVQQKTTNCTYEIIIHSKYITPLKKDDIVPYKIMSFDIEASSSHGDFPVPIKSYKKLATNIVDYLTSIKEKESKDKQLTKKYCIPILRNILKAAFGFETMENIDLVYPKEPIQSIEELNNRTEQWLVSKVRDAKQNDEYLIESMFERANKSLFTNDNNDNDNVESDDDSDSDGEADEYEEGGHVPKINTPKRLNHGNDTTIVDILCNNEIDREIKLDELIRTLRNYFPQLEGDKVTFIGSTFLSYGTNEPYLDHCIVLNSCDKLLSERTQIESYQTEKEVLLAWSQLMQRENPDIIIGYNIFGFDYEFMFRRSQELNCVEEFLKLSRNNDEICASSSYQNPDKLDIERSSTTLASGTYELSIIKMNGRLQIDMLNWYRRNENLNSYKLDYVSGHFIGDSIKKLEHHDNVITRCYTKNMTGLQIDSYIHFEEINHSSNYYKDGQKFKVTNMSIHEGWFDIEGIETPKGKDVRWGLAKDDVTPKDIFRMTREGPTSRAIIAKYCIQDCNLVHHLFRKSDVITALVEMASLCSVPMSFIIFRGQGIKLTSFVAKKCREYGILMPTIDKGSEDEGYEGAVVLEPKCGLHFDPTAVGDFASLYPSVMKSENICPSTKTWVKIFDLAGNIIKEIGEKDESGDFKYDNLPGREYVDVQFDTFVYVKNPAKPKARPQKVKSGYAICRYVQPVVVDGVEQVGVMPSILTELLTARKNTRNMQKTIDDQFMYNVLEQRQLQYKGTANSLYGQFGSKTSTFYDPDIASSTTATGRLLLTFSKKIIEQCYDNVPITTSDGVQVVTHSDYIYGDTDSVFFKLNLTYAESSEKVTGQKALEYTIEIAQEVCHTASKVLKQPHDFEYEKTFHPLCLLSKKKYAAIEYNFDPKKGKRKDMGNVSKRRDNSPIVKDVYGGVMDILMKEQNVQKSIDYVHSCLQNLIDGRIPIDKLIISKSLRSFYKNPQGVAHKVLADRIGEREPGNKPTSGDRVPYVFIVTKATKGKKPLQGDKIETPSFILENKLQIDYSYYITNQIMKPLLQLYGLVLNDIWMSMKPPRRAKVTKLNESINQIKNSETDNKKRDKKIAKLKDKEVTELIFADYLRETTNIKNGNQNIKNFFTPIKTN
jgi:DNA polymerase elongation subunit (family B)